MRKWMRRRSAPSGHQDHDIPSSDATRLRLERPHAHMVDNWCREYRLEYVNEYLQALVQVQGTHSVGLTFTNGLEAENLGDKTSASASVPRPPHLTLDRNLFNKNTFLASHSFLHQGSTESHIVAASSHPWTLANRHWPCLSRSDPPFVDCTQSPGRESSPDLSASLMFSFSRRRTG